MFGDPPEPDIILPAPEEGDEDDEEADPSDEKPDPPEPPPSTMMLGPFSLDTQLSSTVMHTMA